MPTELRDLQLVVTTAVVVNLAPWWSEVTNAWELAGARDFADADVGYFANAMVGAVEYIAEPSWVYINRIDDYVMPVPSSAPTISSAPTTTAVPTPVPTSYAPSPKPTTAASTAGARRRLQTLNDTSSYYNESAPACADDCAQNCTTWIGGGRSFQSPPAQGPDRPLRTFDEPPTTSRGAPAKRRRTQVQAVHTPRPPLPPTLLFPSQPDE